jgi:DNA polymerase
MLVAVYDIQNCGPRHRFVANGKLVHNSDKINLQNLPSRGENAGTLKSSILPPPGYVIIDADSAQIEARILAWLSGQTDLVEAFRNKQDVYSIMASLIYAKPVDQITKQERFVGKTVILGCGYGTGAAKLQVFLKGATPSIEMTLDECRHIVDTYRRNYFKIPKLWDQGNTAIAAAIDGQTAPFGRPEVIKLAFGMFHTPLGIPIKYHRLRRWRDPKGQEKFLYDSRTGKTDIWGGKLTENIVQHLARIIIGLQMIRISKRYRVVLTVHDAIGCVVKKEEALESQAYVEECMRWAPEWAQGLPLNCESGIGENYGQC